MTILGCLVASSLAGCAALGGCLAYHKHRAPLEGLLLGLFLGPIGVLIEYRHPYSRRPMVDEDAWRSLRSMMDYQSAGGESERRKAKSTG